MVRLRHAWLLNFDAEDELARPAGYTPSRAMLERCAALAPHVRALLGPDDVVLAETPTVTTPSRTGGMLAEFNGRAWCPTPRALRALRAAGAQLRSTPPLPVLQAVNHRKFSADLGQTLPGACFALTPDEVARALAGPSPTGQWLLKRPYGYAGRGRLKLDPARPGDLDRAQAWIQASLRSGEGLQVEPLAARRGDFALHGHLRPEGGVVLGEPTCQRCDDTGAWLGSTRAAPGDLSSAERTALLEHAGLAAAALHRAGYFGPFGVDAFRWEGPSGERRFNPRCEINARYSMGWPAGMGDRRPDLEPS
jgi:hypothetical protein